MLIEKEDGRTYDRFRDRIMFPIRDARGRFIAFGGRVLGDEKPKYLNSPETPIFQKGRELYGLYEARKIRQKLTRFIIVEGYMDVVALAEYGIHYAVATLGTATSEHHLRRLFKIVPEVIFCFDGDNAGRTAAARAMETVLPVLSDGVQARFLFLPDGEDPDTLVRKEGKDAFEERLNKSVHLPEFLFDFLKKQVDFDTLDGKARLDQLAAPLINKIPAGMLKKLMKKRLEDEIGMSSEALADMNNIPVPATVLDYDLPPEEPSINISDYLPNDESEQHPLAPSVYKSLVQIVRQPSLAQQLELPNADPETEYERLLLEVIRKLNLAPQQGSVGLLIQWIGTPYQAELQQMAESGSDGHIPPSANDINDVLKRMGARHLDVELNKLKAKFERGEKLSTEERQRLQELKRQRHEMNKKRTNIYRR
jgi:DNA primase